MCAKLHPNRTTFSERGLARKKVVKEKSTNFTRCSTYSAPIIKSWVKGNVGKWVFTCSVVNYLHYVWAKIHPNPTTFGVKELARKKRSKEKAQNSRDPRTFLLPMTEYRVKGSSGSWNSLCSLVNYLQYVCAKYHPNRKNFRVKRLASKEVRTTGSNFTRCSTFSASNDKMSVQRELKKLKLCMYLINYFHYVCAKHYPNPTFLRVKGIARQKVVKPKSPNFPRFSTYSASDDKSPSQRELKKLKLCMYLINDLHYVCAKFNQVQHFWGKRD